MRWPPWSFHMVFMQASIRCTTWRSKLHIIMGKVWEKPVNSSEKLKRLLSCLQVIQLLGVIIHILIHSLFLFSVCICVCVCMHVCVCVCVHSATVCVYPLIHLFIVCVSLFRPPGHHAECSAAMGFCFFNNVAIAAAYAKNKFGIKRWEIVGLDHLFVNRQGQSLIISLSTDCYFLNWTSRITCEGSKSAQEQRIALLKSDQQQQLQLLAVQSQCKCLFPFI